MNNHQKLQLIRHLKRAERAYLAATQATAGTKVWSGEARAVLDDCRETLAWVQAMPTTDSALALNIRDEAMAPAHPGRA